jgi:hypothetical protein
VSARRLRAVVVTLALASSAFGLACGDDPGADMTPEAATELGTEVQTVRASIAAGDLDGARAQLGALRTTVVELTTTGAITDDRAVEVNAAITALEEQLVALAQTTTTIAPPTTPAPTTTSTTTTSTTTTTTEAPAKDPPGKRDKGKSDDDD